MEYQDFNIPFDGQLGSDYRWLKLAMFIPWAEFEVAYAKNLFSTG